MVSCQAKPDATIPVKFDGALSKVNLNAEVYYTHLAKNECEIGLVNSVKKETFTVLSSAISQSLAITSAPGETNIAFTIYRSGGLHQDSAVFVKDIYGISRYFLKNEKLYHQLFMKNTDNSFSELTALYAEVDGVIFNYMHSIGKQVLKMPEISTALFLKAEEAAGVYSQLHKPHDDLKWKLKVFVQKGKLAALKIKSSPAIYQKEESLEGNCGAPCTKNDGSICRNGDRMIEGGTANCGPNQPAQCRMTQTYDFIKDNKEVDPNNIALSNGRSSTLDQCINLDNFRSFRDNILYNSEIGIRFIEYYYELSNHLNETIDLSIALKTAMVSFDLTSSIKKLTDTEADPNEVFLTRELKSEIFDLLSLYKTQTTDETGLQTISSIIEELNALEGKSIADLRRLLGL